jgi:nitrous oxide reductase
MAQKPDPKKLLIDMQQMIESDLMKARHYLKQGVKVAIVAEDQQKSNELATFYVELDDLVDRFSKSFRKLVD